MSMLNDTKVSLRISNSAYDVEITDLIAGARQDLILSGVLPAKANSNTDPLIRRAIVTYVKAHFGYDNPDAERLYMAYDRIKMHLTLAGDYS